MKIFLLILCFCQSYGQELFTGSIIIDNQVYSGIAGNLPQMAAANLPPAVDLTQYLPPVGEQGRQNSCVAWAIAYGAQAYYAKKSNASWNYTNSSGELNYSNLFSPSFVYNQINKGVDLGSNYIDALELLKNQGVCTLDRMQYSASNVLHQPTQEAKEQANNFKIERYVRLGEKQDLLNDVKDQLANSHPVIASAISDVNYLSGGYQPNRPNPYLWQTIGSFNPQMGHAILIVGYDDSRSAFKFVNSYGPSWGNSGFGWISYSIFGGVVRQAFVMKPSFSNIPMTNNPIAENRNNINQSDINIGLNLYLTNVQHMNSTTHPHIPPSQRFMTVTGSISIPANTGNSAQVILYYYLIDNLGNRAPLQGFLPEFRLQSGQAMSSTPPLSISQAITNLQWYSTIPYFAFPRNPNPALYPPITYIVEAEPALIIDKFPVRLGQAFRFTVTQ